MKLYSDNDCKRIQAIKSSNLECGRSDFRRDYSRLIHSPSFRRLQGKTQLFPGIESDFFRNRLTHSLEVAQISKGIGLYLNSEMDFFKKNNLNLDILEIAGLAHDLGHPPFGHNGERALNDLMLSSGGFEGNAQTLRVLTRLERKEKIESTSLIDVDSRNDYRLGLNLTYRTLASILKYDSKIPNSAKTKNKVNKGYYYFDSEIVKKIKYHVCGKEDFKKFKTVECQIMDIADDIAYSTYDLEDAFKVGFLTPFDLLAADEEIINKICTELMKKHQGIDSNKVKEILYDLFSSIILSFIDEDKIKNIDKKGIVELTSNAYRTSKKITSDSYIRTTFTSQLVNMFISKGIDITINEEYPMLTKVSLKEDIGLIVDILKIFTYISLINSSMLKVSEYRGYDIVKSLFDAIKKDIRLLREDFQLMHRTVSYEFKDRIICDFIAGMTDRYAIEFYGRLYSENPQTIFKPF